MNNQASDYNHFKFDASEFNNDLNIGLSKTGKHSDKKWEILIGGHGATQTLIRQDAVAAHTTPVFTKHHTPDDFNRIKGNIELFVNDGRIIIKADGEIFMQYANSSIKKNELRYLMISGSWGGFGTCKVWGFTTKGEFIKKTTINNNSALTPCELAPCLNGGVCVADNASGSRTCNCATGYSGDSCEISNDDWKQINLNGKVFNWKHIGKLA